MEKKEKARMCWALKRLHDIQMAMLGDSGVRITVEKEGDNVTIRCDLGNVNMNLIPSAIRDKAVFAITKQDDIEQINEKIGMFQDASIWLSSAVRNAEASILNR